ncbi:MAG: hypothetical protein Q9201_006251 [Fulgogasparrea decipioides]
MPSRPFLLSSSIMRPSNLCDHPACPLRFPHAQGLYLHMGYPPFYTSEELNFGQSNPPPEVWIARERLLSNNYSLTDHNLVHGFIHLHRVGSVALTEFERFKMEQDREGKKLDDEDAEMEMEIGGLEEEIRGVTIDPCANYPDGSMNGGNANRDASPSPSTLELAEKLIEAMDEAEMEDVQEAAANMNIDEQPGAEQSCDEPLAVDEGVAGLIE